MKWNDIIKMEKNTIDTNFTGIAIRLSSFIDYVIFYSNQTLSTHIQYVEIDIQFE